MTLFHHLEEEWSDWFVGDECLSEFTVTLADTYILFDGYPEGKNGPALDVAEKADIATNISWYSRCV